MKKFWFKRILMFVPLVIAGVLLISAVVMGLWNAILPAVLGVKAITFIQALGILILSKILFGGFRGRRCHCGPGRPWQHNMKEKWDSMTPEEKEKFKSEWKNRCGGGRWKMHESDSPEAIAE